MEDSYLCLGERVFAPFNNPGDILALDPDEMLNPDIQRLISVGRLEIIENPETLFAGSIPDPMDGVVPVYARSQEALTLTKCLGITKKGTRCNRDVTFKGGKEAPLCKDHGDQINDIEYDSNSNTWHRKDEVE